MNNYVTDAINLKSYNLSESDKIVVMYSKDKGLMRVVAKGVKKPKSKLGASMDILIANKLMCVKGKNLDTICQAQALNTFRKTRSDMDKIFYSAYVSEVVNNFGSEEDPSSEETYGLLYKALEKISDAQDRKEILLAVIKFQLKMMELSGFGVELDSCLCCREQIKQEDMYFSSRMGGVVCADCNDTFRIPLKLHYKMRDFLLAMLQFDFEFESDWDKKATQKVCEVSFNLLKEYVEEHSSKKFKSTELLSAVGV